MKKIYILILLLIALLSLWGCRNNSHQSDEDTTTALINEKTEDYVFHETLVINPDNPQTEAITTEPYDIIEENPFVVSFRYVDEEYIFYYTAPISGIYRFDMATTDVTCDYNLRIYDSINNKLCDENYSCYTNGASLGFKKDETYKIILSQKDGLPTATVTIGIPNETVYLEDNFIYGKINYIDQENIYIFHTNLSGYYRFDFKTNNVDYNYTVYLIDEINQELFREDYSTYSNGKSIYLDGNEDYTIIIKYKDGKPKYNIIISEPIPPTYVNSSFSGSVSFIGQQNIYYFTPQEDGTYNISISFSNVEGSCELIMKDSTNYKLFSTSNNYPVEVELNKEIQYMFIVNQKNEFLDYSVSIEPK